MPFTQMSPTNYHCLDINYKTEMELKTMNTYIFMLFVFLSFFFFHLNNFKNIEIRRLYSELDTIKKTIKCGESSESSEGSDSDSDSSEGESAGLVQTIKFKGRKYIMN
jgi:hypothetical protein